MLNNNFDIDMQQCMLFKNNVVKKAALRFHCTRLVF